MKTIARLHSAPTTGATWPGQQRPVLRNPAASAANGGPQTALAAAPTSNGGTQAPALSQCQFNKMKSRIKVLLVDDHPVVRKGIGSCLARNPNLEIVGEAGDGWEAVRK